MSKKLYYRQCRLRKDHKNGCFSEQISFLPEPFCVKNKVVKLRDSEGVWDDGWVVIWASELRRLEDDLPDAHQEIKGHRKASGDSLKKQA